jgi:exosortase
MSGAPAATTNTSAVGARPQKAVLGGLFPDMTSFAMALALAGAFVLLFMHFFLRQHRFSMAHPSDWGHAYIVPLISGYALWKNREAISRIRPERFWPGLAPLLLGIGCFYFFTIIPATSNHMAQGFSLVLAIFGVCLMLLGPRMIIPLMFPIAYLLLGVTVSEQIMIKTTFYLQNVAARGGWILLNLVGFNTELTGNVLTITTSSGDTVPLNVAEACSGMRMVVAFLALGVAVAYFSCTQWWQRVALVLLAAPVAVLTNVIRVASLGILSVVAPDFAKGEAHVFIGTLWLVPALFAYLAIVWALNKMVAPEPSATAKATGATSS